MTQSTLLDICEGLERAIQNGTEMKLHTYDYVKDLGHLPGVVIVPDKADFMNAFNQGSDEWFFNLFVLVSTKEGDKLAQNRLRELCDSHGPNSIRRAIADDNMLGTTDLVAFVYGLKGYAGKFQWNTAPHLGAVLQVKVQYV